MPILFNHGCWGKERYPPFLGPYSGSLKYALLPDLHMYPPKNVSIIFHQKCQLCIILSDLWDFYWLPTSLENTLNSEEGWEKLIGPIHKGLPYIHCLLLLGYSSFNLTTTQNYQSHLDAQTPLVPSSRVTQQLSLKSLLADILCWSRGKVNFWQGWKDYSMGKE